MHGHLLKPGDLVRTDWSLRSARPPYDLLPIPRAKIPPGVILSRDGGAWIQESNIHDVALPMYQGIMIQPFVPSAQSWVSGTGLRAKWTHNELENLSWNPHFLINQSSAKQGQNCFHAKIGYRRVARNTDARSIVGAVLPSFPCGDSVFSLYLGEREIDDLSNVAALFNSFIFDWIIRQRLGATNLNWYILAEGALPRRDFLPSLLPFIIKLNLFASPFAAVQTRHAEDSHHALHASERLRLRSILDAVSCAAYGCDAADLRHILRDSDLPASELNTGSSNSASLDPRGFWRVDRNKDPELRHTVLTLIAFRDLESKIESAGGDRRKGIEAFLTQNHGEGWMLPETLCLADHDLGHDERARHPQPVASRLGPRFYDWQLVQSAEESWRECYLHARNLLGAHEYALILVDLIERHAGDGKDYLGLLTDGFTRELLGDDGYTTVLVEIRARSVVDEDTYWTTIGALRNGGHLDDTAYGQLLDELHARGHLDDLGYRRRRGYIPPSPSPSAERWLRVAEDRADYRASTPPEDPQPDLFE